MCLAALAVASVSAFARQARADAWQILYQNDFAADPGWSTDDPSGMRWDAASQTYHGTQVNTEGTYAFKTISGFDPNAPWRLEFDSMIVSAGWSSGLTFGLTDFTRLYFNGAAVDRGLVDQGFVTSLNAPGANQTVSNPQWASGEWYTHIMEYDPALDALSLIVSVRGTGAPFATMQINVPGFSNDMIHLAATRLHMKNTGPGASGSASVDYYIDNVTLYGVPAPGAPALLAVGAALAARRRRTR
jgi:hypothetical protein